MKLLKKDSDVIEILKGGKNVILYIGSKDCSVCHDLYHKVEYLEEKYSEIDFYRIEYGENLKVMGELLIYTLPAIIGYMEGKEYLREARFISLEDIRSKIDRYYNFMGDD